MQQKYEYWIKVSDVLHTEAYRYSLESSEETKYTGNCMPTNRIT